jgi:hypothetical protein
MITLVGTLLLISKKIEKAKIDKRYISGLSFFLLYDIFMLWLGYKTGVRFGCH